MRWWPTVVFLPGKSHGQRSLAGYSPWGPKRVRHDLATKHACRKFKDDRNCSVSLSGVTWSLLSLNSTFLFLPTCLSAYAKLHPGSTSFQLRVQHLTLLCPVVHHLQERPWASQPPRWVSLCSSVHSGWGTEWRTGHVVQTEVLRLKAFIEGRGKGSRDRLWTQHLLKVAQCVVLWPWLDWKNNKHARVNSCQDLQRLLREDPPKGPEKMVSFLSTHPLQPSPTP